MIYATGHEATASFKLSLALFLFRLPQRCRLHRLAKRPNRLARLNGMVADKIHIRPHVKLAVNVNVNRPGTVLLEYAGGAFVLLAGRVKELEAAGSRVMNQQVWAEPTIGRNEIGSRGTTRATQLYRMNRRPLVMNNENKGRG